MTAEANSGPGGAPARVGRYEIRGLLASNPTDRVYTAFDPLIERPVVVRLFPLPPARTGADRGVAELFSTAMQRAGALTHPAIVALYDAGEDGDAAFTASEFVAGESLEAFLGRGYDLDLPLRVSLLLQIGDALEYARERGVPHLDLKPTRVRITDDYMVKVGSFGVAVVTDALVARGAGRPRSSRYDAPERQQGGGDSRADVYSLAQIAIDVLVGAGDRPPGDIPGLPSSLAARGVDAKAWDAVFSHALDPEPAGRIGTPGLFALDLLATLDLGEAEARLAWETSRALGSFANLAAGPPASSASSGGPSADGPAESDVTTISASEHAPIAVPAAPEAPTSLGDEAETVLGAERPAPGGGRD